MMGCETTELGIRVQKGKEGEYMLGCQPSCKVLESEWGDWGGCMKGAIPHTVWTPIEGKVHEEKWIRGDCAFYFIFAEEYF